MPRFYCCDCRDSGQVIDQPRQYGDAAIGSRCPSCSPDRFTVNPWIEQARRDREAADAAVDAACAAGNFGPVTDHTQHGAAGWRNDK